MKTRLREKWGGRGHIALVLLLLAGVGYVLWHRAESAAGRAREAEVRLLRQATTVHVLVAGRPLVFPLAALPEYTRMGAFFALDRRKAVAEAKVRADNFFAAASNPATAPALEMVAISIETYGWNNDNAALDGIICPMMERQWAKEICDNPWSPLRQALPSERLYLADRRPELFDHHLTVGRERVGDQLRAMDLVVGRASVVCDREISASTQFCTAAQPIDDRLVAVWTVTADSHETPQAKAAREGSAIAAFIEDALGPTEDFARLTERACVLRRAGSRDQPNRPALCT